MPIYNNIDCPKCGKVVHKQGAGVHCPKYQGVVCMGHCFNECQYMDLHSLHCGFSSSEEARRRRERLAILEAGATFARIRKEVEARQAADLENEI